MSFRTAIAMGCVSLVFLKAIVTFAQNLPPCGGQRPAYVDAPWAAQGDLWCVESVLNDNSLGAIGVTHMAAPDDGSLYATVPMLGQVIHIVDTNGDALPDSQTVILEGLTRPIGIDYHDQALYIAGNANLYRYDLNPETLTVLVDDLPWGWTGYPTSGVTVHEERIYVTIGGDVACTPGRGAIYSFDLNGNDRQIVARGLHSPADVAFYNDRLWVVDTVTDRLLQVTVGVDYGACSGETPSGTIAHSFNAGSHPIALAPYQQGVHQPLESSLLVALRGEAGRIIVEGYEVVSVEINANGTPAGERAVLPVLPTNLNVSEQKMHIQESGFYPHHVYGVAVDGHGWVYISAGAGQIFGLRGL